MEESEIKILRYLNLWPKIGRENEKPFTIITVTSLILYYWLPIGCLLHLTHSIIEDGINHLIESEVVEDVVEIVSFTGMFTGIVSFLMNRKRLMILKDRLNNFANFGEPKFLVIYKKRAYDFYKFYLISINLCIITYSLFPILEYPDCVEHNRKYNKKNICGITTYVWLPFNIDYFPMKQIYVVLTVMFTWLCCNGAACCVILLFGNLQLILCRIRHLIEIIDNLNHKEFIRQKKMIVFIVQYHNSIKSLVYEMNDCYSTILFIFVLWVPIVLALTAYQFLLEHRLKQLLHSASWLISLFTPCYCGQSLINESEKIPEAIYNIYWYEMDYEIQKNLYTIELNLLNPMGLNCKGFGYLSFSLFQKVIKTAYSYVALLNQMM